MPPSATLKRLLEYRLERRRRDPHEFLVWPAWDMLLDLALTQLEGRQLAVSALCSSTGAPQSTCLRKLAQLEAAGLVSRSREEGDKRRISVELTQAGRDLVYAWLEQDMQFLTRLAGDARP